MIIDECLIFRTIDDLTMDYGLLTIIYLEKKTSRIITLEWCYRHCCLIVAMELGQQLLIICEAY